MKPKRILPECYFLANMPQNHSCKCLGASEDKHVEMEKRSVKFLCDVRASYQALLCKFTRPFLALTISVFSSKSSAADEKCQGTQSSTISFPLPSQEELLSS